MHALYIVRAHRKNKWHTSIRLAQVGQLESSKSAMYTLAPELRALITCQCRTLNAQQRKSPTRALTLRQTQGQNQFGRKHRPGVHKAAASDRTATAAYSDTRWS